MKLIFVSTVLLTFFVSGDKLTGRWQTKPSDKGNVTSIVFNGDHTYEGYINKKPFVSGKYSLRRNTFTIEESGCNGSKAIYKIIFFSGSDSLRFQPVSDSCTERREGMSRTILGRVK